MGRPLLEDTIIDKAISDLLKNKEIKSLTVSELFKFCKSRCINKIRSVFLSVPNLRVYLNWSQEEGRCKKVKTDKKEVDWHWLDVKVDNRDKKYLKSIFSYAPLTPDKCGVGKEVWYHSIIYRPGREKVKMFTQAFVSSDSLHPTYSVRIGSINGRVVLVDCLEEIEKND